MTEDGGLDGGSASDLSRSGHSHRGLGWPGPAPNTYGEHQEAAAAHLTHLMTRGMVPHDPNDVPLVVYYREVALDALGQRLGHLMSDPRHLTAKPARDGHLERPTLRAITTATQRNPLKLLEGILDNAPRPAPNASDLTPSPLTLLATPHRDLTVERWRRTAVELLAGSHALESAPELPWLDDRGAAWFLIGDTAATLEAITVIDSALAAAALLPTPTQPALMRPDEARLICSQVTRAAGWWATSNTPDLARAPQPHHRPAIQRVVMVSDPADLAAAQRNLASLVAPRDGRENVNGAVALIDAHTAKYVAINEAALMSACAAMADRSGAHSILVQHFIQRQFLLERLARQTRLLVDVAHPTVNQVAVAQMQEMATRARTFAGNGHLTPAQVADLANASHEALTGFAYAFRREGVRDDSRLRLASNHQRLNLTRLYRRGPTYNTLTELMNTPAPVAPQPSWTGLQRQALRQLLDDTPAVPVPRNPASPGRASLRPR